MTVQSTAVQTTAIANGGVTTFTYQFKLQEATDLVVQLIDLIGAVHGPLVLNSDYTVDPLGLNLDAGGNILNCTYLGVNIPNGWTVVMTREMALTQDTDLANQGTYLPESVETELDAVVMMVQGHDFQLARTIHGLLTDSAMPALPPALQRLGMYLQFDPVTGMPNAVPGAPSVLKDNFAASSAPTSANDNTQGYSEGSRWFDTTHNTVYLCMSAATGAAVWVQMVIKDNLTAVVAPSTANDSTQGYSTLSRWLNTASNNLYMCVSAAPGAAIWLLLTATVPTPLGKNYFVDPGCRVTSADGSGVALSTNYKYSQVALVQFKASGTVTAGTLVQSTSGSGQFTPSASGYGAMISNATITGAGVFFARRTLEANDAVALANTASVFGSGMVTVALRISYRPGGGASPAPATITINGANSLNNFGAVTNIATSGSFNVLANTPQQQQVFTFSITPAQAANGIEIIVQLNCGAVTGAFMDTVDWQIVPGASVPAYPIMQSFEEDMAKVMRYYEASYEYGTTKGTVTNNGMTVIGAPGGWGSGTTYGELFQAKYRAAKVISPSVTVYSPNNGSSGNAYAFIAAANKAMTATSDTSMFYLTAGANVADSDALQFHWVADARL